MNMTLDGTVDGFDADLFRLDLSVHLAVSLGAITLTVRAASVAVSVRVAAVGMPEGQRIEARLLTYNASELSAALGDAYTVVALSEPTLQLLATPDTTTPITISSDLSGGGSVEGTTITTLSVLLPIALLLGGGFLWRSRVACGRNVKVVKITLANTVGRSRTAVDPCEIARDDSIIVSIGEQSHVPRPPAGPPHVKVELRISARRFVLPMSPRPKARVHVGLSIAPAPPPYGLPSLASGLLRLLQPPSAGQLAKDDRTCEWTGPDDEDAARWLQSRLRSRASTLPAGAFASSIGSFASDDSDDEAAGPRLSLASATPLPRKPRGTRLTATGQRDDEWVRNQALGHANAARERAKARATAAAGVGGAVACSSDAAAHGSGAAQGAAVPCSLDPLTAALQCACVTGAVPASLPSYSHVCVPDSDEQAMARVRARVETARNRAKYRRAGQPYPCIEAPSPLAAEAKADTCSPAVSTVAAKGILDVPEGGEPESPKCWVQGPGGTWCKTSRNLRAKVGAAPAASSNSALSTASPALATLAVAATTVAAAAGMSEVEACSESRIRAASEASPTRKAKTRERVERARARKRVNSDAPPNDTRLAQLRWLERATVYGVDHEPRPSPRLAEPAVASTPAAAPIASSSGAHSASRTPPRSPVRNAQGWLAQQLQLAALASSRDSFEDEHAEAQMAWPSTRGSRGETTVAVDAIMSWQTRAPPPPPGNAPPSATPPTLSSVQEGPQPRCGILPQGMLATPVQGRPPRTFATECLQREEAELQASGNARPSVLSQQLTHPPLALPPLTPPPACARIRAAQGRARCDSAACAPAGAMASGAAASITPLRQERINRDVRSDSNATAETVASRI